MRLPTNIFISVIYLILLTSCGAVSNNSGVPQATLPLPENDTTGIIISTTNQVGYVVIEASAGVVPADMELIVQVIDASQNPDTVGSAGCEGEIPVCPDQNAFGECRQTPFEDGSVVAMTTAEVTDYLWISFQNFNTCETTDAMEVQITDTEMQIPMDDVQEMTTDVVLNSIETAGLDAVATDDTNQEVVPQDYPPAPVGMPQPIKPKKRSRPKPNGMVSSETPFQNPNLPSEPIGEQVAPLPTEFGQSPLPTPADEAFPLESPEPQTKAFEEPYINDADLPIGESRLSIRDYRGEALFHVMEQTEAVLFHKNFPDHSIILFATNLDASENFEDSSKAYYMIRADRIEIDKPLIITASTFVGKALGPVDVFEDFRPAINSTDGKLLPIIVFKSSVPAYEREFSVHIEPDLAPL